MSFNKYYQDELITLKELGQEFAKKNPGLAPFLATSGRDPDVERILEGFAFLTGRLRQKLDDELPEITHALFNLLWPNYLRPVPSCSIVKYYPSESLSGNLTIPRGTKVESVLVDDENCQFTTVYDVDISPIELQKVEAHERDSHVALSLKFNSLTGPINNLELGNIKFFLSGEAGLATSLYFILLKKTAAIEISCTDEFGAEKPFIILDPDKVRPVGFDESETMLPYPSNTFPGYRLLQEYFCFQEKFLFVELTGLEGFAEKIPEKFKNKTSFTISFRLRERPDEAELFNVDNIQLFCTPVVNLFHYDAAPLLIDHRQTEYRIVPDPKRPYNYAVYSVDRVSSWHHNTKSDIEYASFESFEHGNGIGQAPGYYRLRIKSALHDQGTETYISVINSNQNLGPSSETISLELTCTNRLLPQKLSRGDICLPSDNSPEHVTFKNITAVSGSYAPPLEGNLAWRLISNMSLNYISLINIQALKTVITAYDFRALHDKRRALVHEQILKGLIKVESYPTDRIHQGLPLRGANTSLTLDQNCFSSEGDMYLFGSIMNEFLALYATINSFHQLKVIEHKTGEVYSWPARLGKAISL